MIFLPTELLNNQLGTFSTPEQVREHCWPHSLTLFSVTHLLPGHSVRNTVFLAWRKSLIFMFLMSPQVSPAVLLLVNQTGISQRKLAVQPPPKEYNCPITS